MSISQSTISTLRRGDALTVLRTLETESVNCIVTSPPYFGLRDYGTAQWVGGDTECDHRHPAERRQIPHGDGRVNDSYAEERHGVPGVGALYRDVCGRCGAIRKDEQIGLEQTLTEYLAKMVAVFAECRRVLKKDGTCWINMGDSYASRLGGLKEKDLMGVPWRIAFALQDDGWYLRSDIIWSKNNPMPESVRDRPTKSHEYIFMLTKSARYWYDADAISEPVSENTHMRISQNVADQIGSERAVGKKNGNMKAVVRQPKTTDTGSGVKNNESFVTACCLPVLKRNARTVWTIATESFKEAHFATFPREIPRRCILAGCPEGGVVLDPFAGACTTGKVAIELGRVPLMIELNPKYCEMGEKRMRDALIPLGGL